MYEFDILLLDVTSAKYYDYHTLNREPLGGTEATVVRVMEGLAGFGLKVAIVLSNPSYFEPMTSKFAFYFHVDDLPKLKCKHYIQLRGIGNSHLFPKAQKYVWLHDTADEKLRDWNNTIGENKMTVICVSKSHRRAVKDYLVTSNVEYIYNPVPDEIYKSTNIELTYDKNNFVWAASPHKGLGKALEVFKRVKARLSSANLVIANPGYLNLDTVSLSALPGVSVIGPQPCKTMWAILQKSLCMFYPSQFDETFGLILAESNALGVPMLGYQHGVLKEVVGTGDQLVEDGNEDALVDRAIEWSEKGRPKVEGREEFKLSRIIFKWVQMLGGVR